MPSGGDTRRIVADDAKEYPLSYLWVVPNPAVIQAYQFGLFSF